MSIQAGSTGCVNSDNTNYIGRLIGGYVIGVVATGPISANNAGAIVASIPNSGPYTIHGYFNQVAGCATPGPGGVSFTVNWADPDGSRTDGPYTLAAAITPGNASYGQIREDVNLAGASAVTIPFTYTACTTGTFTYRLLLWVARQ